MNVHRFPPNLLVSFRPNSGEIPPSSHGFWPRRFSASASPRVASTNSEGTTLGLQFQEWWTDFA